MKEQRFKNKTMLISIVVVITVICGLTIFVTMKLMGNSKDKETQESINFIKAIEYYSANNGENLKKEGYKIDVPKEDSCYYDGTNWNNECKEFMSIVSKKSKENFTYALIIIDASGNVSNRSKFEFEKYSCSYQDNKIDCNSKNKELASEEYTCYESGYEQTEYYDEILAYYDTNSNKINVRGGLKANEISNHSSFMNMLANSPYTNRFIFYEKIIFTLDSDEKVIGVKKEYLFKFEKNVTDEYKNQIQNAIREDFDYDNLTSEQLSRFSDKWIEMDGQSTYSATVVATKDIVDKRYPFQSKELLNQRWQNTCS